MIKYYIIGVGPGDPELITKKAEKTVYKMNVLAGGERQLALFPDFPGPKFRIGKDLSVFWDALCKYNPPYGILASGDPVFYSILGFIKKKVPLSEIEVIPGISSIQYMLAKEKKTAWHIEVISHHWGESVKGGHFRFELNMPPDRIKREHILGENLSLESESIGKGLKPEGTLYLTMEKIDNLLLPGLPDDLFEKGESPMTKREVRVLIVSALSLSEGGVVWDLGAGTGAISCEIARLSPSIKVYAVEKVKERVNLIKRNIEKTGAYNVEVVHKDALGAIPFLPDPDSVFVGGGGHDIEKILKAAYDRLKKRGKLVFSAISLETSYRGYRFLKNNTFSHRLISIQVEVGKETGGLTMMRSQNRIFIGEGTK